MLRLRRSSSSASTQRFELQQLRAPVEQLCFEIIKEYKIDPSTVTICIDKHGVPRYLVNEPELDEEGRRLYSMIMEHMYTSTFRIDSEDELRKALEEVVEDLGVRPWYEKYREILWYYIRRDSFGYGVLDTLFRDPDVEDIELSDWRRPVTVVHRGFLGFEALVTNVSFRSEEEARSVIERLALKTGRSISLAKPELHAALPEGYRIAATLGDPVSASPTFSIRKFPPVPIDVITLINEEVVDPKIAALVWLLNDAKMFYVVIGGSGSGKTTLLNALLQLSNPMWKIVVVQDIPELRLPSRPRFIQLFGESSEEQLKRCITALRYRPDILVVGEVRGKEIRALVRAVASGSGSATTFHAATPGEFEMALRNLLPRDLFVMLSLNAGVALFISKIREGRKVVRRVVAVYERCNGSWNTIYVYGRIDAIERSTTLKRIGERLRIEDPVEELKRREEFLKSIPSGYDNVEHFLKKFYGV